MIKTCPVAGCGVLILAEALVCREDWMRLPLWARDDLTMLHQAEPDSEVRRRAVAVALAYLDDLAAQRAESA
jgi:hypothetical protein